MGNEQARSSPITARKLHSDLNQVHPERCYSYLDDDKAAAPPVGAPIGCDVNKSKVEAPVEGGSLKLTASSSNAITARKLYSDLNQVEPSRCYETLEEDAD